jgi:Uma2 family endonuclease
MGKTQVPTAQPMTLHLPLDLDDEQLLEFCRANREWRIERPAEGDLELMPPTGGYTSERNSNVVTQLFAWAQRDGTGVVFDSNGGFVLPNGAMRSPDASWVRRERLVDLTAEQKGKFLPLCPDFVVELRSPTDRLATLQEKLGEYVENGARLGWLVDPEERKVHFYGAEKGEVRVLDQPESLSGESVLPGFVLELKRIWEPGF